VDCGKGYSANIIGLSSTTDVIAPKDIEFGEISKIRAGLL